jgi:hypothetical protein
LAASSSVIACYRKFFRCVAGDKVVHKLRTSFGYAWDALTFSGCLFFVQPVELGEQSSQKLFSALTRR